MLHLHGSSAMPSADEQNTALSLRASEQWNRFSVTVKKPSSARARTASSNVALAIAMPGCPQISLTL